MEHPEPFELAVKSMEKIVLLDKEDKSGYVKMVHRKEPIPLYELLDRRGFHRKTIKKSESLFEIYFWLNPQIEIPDTGV